MALQLSRMSKILWYIKVLLSLTAYTEAAFLQRRDQTISTSQRISTYAASFGVAGQLTTVNPGVTYWLSGGGTHNFYGNVFTNGQIVVSQTDYLVTVPGAGGQTADYVGHTTTNGNLNISSTGSISLNDYGSASAPTYDWYLRTFTSYGSLQFCGRGDTGGSTYQLYCDLDCFNYGTLDYGQYNDNIGASFVWRNAALSAPGATRPYNIYNNGALRLTNVVFHNVQNIKGNGCIIVGKGGVLYLEDGTGYYQSYENGAYLPALPSQTISMSGSDAVLHMDTQVYSHNSNFGAQVYGFGPGKAIEFYEILATTNPFSYSALTGILSVLFTSGNRANINIGLGYVPTSFYSARNPQKYNVAGYNAIFYNGVVPAQVVPTACQPALATCTNPALTAGVTPTYTTQTSAYTGTNVITSTVASATGTTPGTVVIYTPQSYVTVSTRYTGLDQLAGPVTSTVAPSGTVAGTVVIYTQPPFITTSAAYTGPGVILAPTTTTIAPSGTAPGTILIITPAAYVTVTTQYTGIDQLASPATSTVAPSGTVAGTVIIYTQPPFITTSAAYTGPGVILAPTTTTIAPSGTAPGTILIITPAAYVTVTTQYTGLGQLANPATSTIAPSGTVAGTVVIYTQAAFVTTSVAYTGPGVILAPTTSTIAPSGTAPGTILVITPAVYVTVTAPYTGTGAIAAPTTTTIPPVGTNPGQVVVYTPVGYVTTTLPYTGTGFINGPQTVTIPPIGTASGTVQILTPTATRPASITTNIGPAQCLCTAA